MGIVGRLDERGTGAWIAAMLAAFVLFWPLGLVILTYMIWSGRMVWMHRRLSDDMREEWRARRDEMHNEIRARREEWRARKRAWREAMQGAWHHGSQPVASSGNVAFDEYRAETLRRLEEEQAEFTAFLEGLRKARDRAEFDQFMQGRSGAAVAPALGGESQPPFGSTASEP